MKFSSTPLTRVFFSIRNGTCTIHTAFQMSHKERLPSKERRGIIFLDGRESLILD